MSSRSVLIVPYERTSSRPGTAAGGRLIAGLIRSMYPLLSVCELNVQSMDVRNLVASQAAALSTMALPKLVIGGNHLVSYAAMVEFIENGGQQILVFDAHHDAYRYPHLTHYSHLHHILNVFDVQITVVGCRYEPELADPRIRLVPIERLSEVLNELGRGYYLSIDLDVLEPTEFASVNHPVPGGIAIEQLLAALDSALACAPSYIDIVEASFTSSCSAAAMEQVKALLRPCVHYVEDGALAMR